MQSLVVSLGDFDHPLEDKTVKAQTSGPSVPCITARLDQSSKQIVADNVAAGVKEENRKDSREDQLALYPTTEMHSTAWNIDRFETQIATI